MDIMDVYPHTVGRIVTCWCGKELPKGTEAFMAVLEPRGNDGYHLNHKIVCSPDCPMIITEISAKEKP
jgi:hypothetical protein